MLGKVRACPSSFESFDTPPSKIIKDDSLSIYETTLMKLKMGSQRHLIPPPDSTDCASENESMVIDTDCSSASVADCSSASVADCSIDDLNSRDRGKSSSILDFFSKFRSHQRTPAVTDQTMMMVEINGSSIEFPSLSVAKDEEIHELNASMGA